MISGRRYKVATIRGIPIYLGSSWIWIAALYVYIRYVDLSHSPWVSSDAEAVGYALLGASLFFGGVLVHEAGHAIVARAFDLPVAGITLVFWGGATEARSDTKGPLAEFLIAMVGPGSTLALAGVFFAVSEGMDPGVVRAIVGELAVLNLWFAGFNALPGFPLDGGRMLLATVWGISRNRNTAIRVAAYAGVAIGVLFFAVAVWSISEGYIGYAIFLGYLGAILVGSGQGVAQKLAVRRQLAQGTVADAMRPPPETVPAAISLSEALDRWLRDNPRSGFPVVENGRVIGMLSLGSARKVGSRDPLRPVRDGMAPLAATPVLAPSDTLDSATEWLAGREGLVLRDGVLVGAIGTGDVERWFKARFQEDGQASAAPPRPDV